MNPKYPGQAHVINGNAAVAHVMSHVCDGVIGYPITPSTEISEIYERFRAGGGINVWGRHPFFYEPEGEHSAQSGALGAALTGGKYVSNASSSQGVLYALESHYVTVGKKVGGFVLHVAARVVSKHSLNVMAGHDDVYALLPSGYTVLFGADPQEAADFAAIAYRVAADSLIPVANAMDGFATSHMMTEARLPEPALLKTFLGDPSERMPCPTVAQEILYGAKGRVHQLSHWLRRHASAFEAAALGALSALLAAQAEAIEADAGEILAQTEPLVPQALWPRWSRLWRNAWPKGTRQRVPALVDPGNPGLTGGVQNQPDHQAGVVDHHTHFVADVPRLLRGAMAEYGDLTGRRYAPVMTWGCDDAETVVVGLGSVTQDAEAVAEHLRRSGRKVGVVAIKQLQPFPVAELVAALAGKRAVTVLERSDVTALTSLVSTALCQARENAEGLRHVGIPPLATQPRLTTAIFGLGAHDLQPRHLVAVYDAMDQADSAPFVWLGTQFFAEDADPVLAGLQDRLAAAYPATRRMALTTGPNPQLLPAGAMRIRFHSVGGYGTVATGKLVTDILSGLLGLHSKAAPKYGSEKSGAPTNYYVTLSPEPIKITNAELEDVEIVVSPDHKVFAHTDPLLGLVEGGTFILQTALSPHALWQSLPAAARATIRARNIRLHVIDAFAVAERHAPSPELATRMMGIAFIGALAAKVDCLAAGGEPAAVLDKIRRQIEKKFGAKGDAVVAGNMAVIREGLEATFTVPWTDPAYAEAEIAAPLPRRVAAVSTAMCDLDHASAPSPLFDIGYFDEIVARPMREGRIGESPVMPGTGLFMPAASAATKDKGLFRRQVPIFDASRCTGCLECTLVCPDAALPASVHDIDDLLATAAGEAGLDPARRSRLDAALPALTDAVRAALRSPGDDRPTLAAAVAAEALTIGRSDGALGADLTALAEVLAFVPVARTNLFFDQFETKRAGTGGLFSIGVDPAKCSGCMECLTVCGADALQRRDQDDALLEEMQTRFAFLSATANTPKRFTETLTGPNAKRLVLDRANYYATTGGHGACRGCGEVTAIRQITAAAHALGDRAAQSEAAAIDGLLAALAGKRGELGDDAVRAARIDKASGLLERRLFELETGPTGAGRAPMVIANATGCSSVYCSTFPFNPYRDPWVNSLFQDTPALAKGIFEGLAADHTEVVKARRIAELELADGYDPASHDKALGRLGWADFTPDELSRLPTVLSMGGDGATYDIGFGALSKLLTTRTPIKVVILNTGAYSNTGGQASSSSLVGQDADLASVGAAHAGKQDDRKELGLIAAFHPEVMVVQTTPALQGHFLKNVLAALSHTGGPVVLDIYTPCQGEHGIGDEVSSRHARLAVQSRANPVLVHDPERGPAQKNRFSLHGNPDPDQDWTTIELQWLDADGTSRTMEVPLTPADFAMEEGRFKKHFKAEPLAPDADGVAIHDFVDLAPEARRGKVPFVWKVVKQQLVRIPVPKAIVALVEERRRHWRMLQHLAGIEAQRRDAAHAFELEALRKRYRELSERLVTLAQSAMGHGEAAVLPGTAVAEPPR